MKQYIYKYYLYTLRTLLSFFYIQSFIFNIIFVKAYFYQTSADIKELVNANASISVCYTFSLAFFLYFFFNFNLLFFLL
jgi:hypothetical protein